MFEKFIKTAENHCESRKIETDAENCKYFERTCYAIDVTFQQPNRPYGFISNKKFIFRKRELYGLKVEPSVIPIGIFILYTKHPGSISNLKIFYQNDFSTTWRLRKLPMV